MQKTIPLSQRRFADLPHPHDVIAWPQGPAEPLALTEALRLERAALPGILGSAGYAEGLAASSSAGRRNSPGRSGKPTAMRSISASKSAPSAPSRY